MSVAENYITCKPTTYYPSFCFGSGILLCIPVTPIPCSGCFLVNQERHCWYVFLLMAPCVCRFCTMTNQGDRAVKIFRFIHRIYTYLWYYISFAWYQMSLVHALLVSYMCAYLCLYPYHTAIAILVLCITWRYTWTWYYCGYGDWWNWQEVIYRLWIILTVKYIFFQIFLQYRQ